MISTHRIVSGPNRVPAKAPRRDRTGADTIRKNEVRTMSEPQFFQARMGKQSYEATMPNLVKQLVRLNELLEPSVCALTPR